MLGLDNFPNDPTITRLYIVLAVAACCMLGGGFIHNMGVFILGLAVGIIGSAVVLIRG